MSIVEFLSQPVWQRLGLTLVHFLWQGLAVAVLVGAFVGVFRLKHGNARYAAYLLAFIAMIVCPVVTFTTVDIPISPDTELVTGAESTEVIEASSYTALPAGDILPEAETSSPALPTVADSIPLGQRMSNWLNVSMPWVLVIWMVGVIVLSLRLLMGFVGVYRWRHHLEPLPERLAQRIVSLSKGLGMRGFSGVFISPTVLQAMAVGYLRPMVLLPAAMVAQMQPEMLEAVIAHELAHIRRFDLWVNLAQRVTETLLFYHPAVWWLSNCLRSERELCCDELAVKATGRRLTYASTLESVGRAKVMAKQPVLAAGLGQDNKPTLGRVRHILGLKPAQRNCPFWLAGVITVLFLAALVIPTTLALTSRTDELADIQEKKNQREFSKFKTTLANGVTVELVGICEYPSAGKQWWRPDGTRFTLPAEIKVEERISSARVGDKAYQFLFRYNSQEDLMWNSLEAVCLHFSIEGDSGVSLINMRRLPKDGQDGLFAKVAIFKEPMDSTTIQANLATGNWQTQAVRDISKIDQRNEDLYWFTSETPSTGNVRLDILHRIEGQQIKTIAIDREGNEYDAGYSLGSFGGRVSISQIEGRRYHASVRKDERLVKFKLQSRPFWSSVIGNVSLKPNFKTDVQIKVGEPNIQVQSQVQFKLITRPLTRKGVELQWSKAATLQYWNEVFDLDSEMLFHYEPGTRRWPKGADIGFDIDMPQEIRDSVFWGINSGYKTTGHRFLALDSYSFEPAVLETSTRLDELRNSKWMGFGLSKLTLTKFPEFFAVLTDGYSVKADSTVEHPIPKLAIIEVVEARDKSAEI
jgi:beta-lactamase regulating signal transducer with metallopeptidase domain